MGEGVMIKDPDSPYEGKRSSYLLKVKQFEDSEAVVESYEDGKGRLKGSTGALRVEEKNTGHKFKIGGGFDD